MALDRGDGALWVVHSLALGNITGKYFATFSKGDYRRRGTRTLSVRDDCWVATFQYGNYRVGGTQVNTYST